MKFYIRINLLILIALVLTNCKQKESEHNTSQKKTIKDSLSQTTEKPTDIETPNGMVWVSSKTFTQGAKENDQLAMQHEKPAHQVYVDGFFIDIHEVTNKEFRAFVNATDYKTVAERPIDWEEMKKQLPANTPKPVDSVLQPGSLTFDKSIEKVASMNNYTQWWTWQLGANWKQPYGKGSSIESKDDLPVVHIAYEDALAYCKWANRRLPTEAEWEAAAQGTNNNQIFTWGDDASVLNDQANTWQGIFPTQNKSKDGYSYIAPVASYPANSIGIYDMLGNVWEWTSDYYNVNYYKELDTAQVINNPRGAEKGYSPQNPYQQEKIIKGGSFLCNASYCASFRISAKMGMSPDSGSDHVGFRTVATPEMLR
ncbi:formylglycine-generating enzyme family protein [Mesonia sp.]|uniref:formylglycine-generating enzyme family protein n=1 Tax=Mesonia sp. TaxID=1960830 RepID=UPI0017618EEB|nr:formylglycine-generating enzyme family protein [Mesonia sp.]HIB38442.1 formylglycine-generating enzyme family protein [Mesonia sp.]HIO26804.1 formylglycine-generating enzyme family protein [Flavobacteriaceae bacterium]